MINSYKPSPLEYTKLVSIVYAVVLMSFGIIFPIAEALKDQWLKTVYNTVYLTFNLTLSSVFLVYLLFYILRKVEKNKSSQIEDATQKIKKLFPTIKKKFQERKNSLGIYKQTIRGQLSTKNDYLLASSKNNGSARNSTNEQHSASEKSCSADEINEFKPKFTKRESFSSTSFGGIDLGHITPKNKDKDKDTESCPDTDLYFQSREIEPATDIPKLSTKTMRRSSICATIQENSGESISSDDSLPPLPTTLKHRYIHGHKHHHDETHNKVNDDDLTWIDAESFGSVFTHHGSNLFLRLGALVFGLGNLVYYALEIQANLFSNVACSNNLRFGWIFIWKFIFVLLQTFFLFKHAKIHVTKHRSLVWFGMVHLIFTNINLWIHTLVREIKDEYHYKAISKTYRTNTTKLNQALNEVCDSDLLHAAAKYLMPFVLEYSLIAVGSVSCFLYFGGIESDSTIRKAKRNLIRVFSLAPSDFDKYNQVMQSDEEEKSLHSETKVRFSGSVVDKLPLEKNDVNPHSHVAFNDLHHNSEAFTNFVLTHDQNPLQKSHMGLFAGVVVLCVTVVTCVVFLFSHLQDNRFRAEIIFYTTDITVHCLLLAACISVFILTRNLAFAPKPVSTDDVLLLIAAFGSMTYEIVNASALLSALTSPNEYSALNAKDYISHAVEVLNTTKGDDSDFKFINKTNTSSPTASYTSYVDYTYIIQDRLQLTSASIGMIQTAVQTLLIFVSLRRYPISVQDAHDMPGRGTLAFLIVGNLSVWILRTALCKNLLMPVQSVFYGEAAWLLLMNIHLPMLLFFRFHSSVCFADIWKIAYQLLTRPEKTNVIQNQ